MLLLLAKKALRLVNTKKRTIYGITNFSLPSRFISEIDDEYLEVELVEDNFEINNNYKIDETVEYSIGDKVSHDIFGKGYVVGIDGKILTIAFSKQHGIKN